MKETFTNLKRVYGYGRKYRKSLFIFTVISLLNIVINVVYPVFTGKQLVALTGSLVTELLVATLICFGLSIFCDFTTVLLRKNTQVFFRGTTRDIQLDVSKEILKIELTSIDKCGSGVFIQRLTNDTDDMSRIFTRGMGYLTAVFSDIGIYVAIFIINKIAFLYFLFVSLILTFLHLKKVQKMNDEEKRFRRQNERTSSLIGELVRGIRDIKMLYAKDSFIDEIEENIDELTNRKFSLRNIEINYNCLIEIVHDVSELVMIILFIILMTYDYLSVASAIVLYNYRTRAFSNLMYNVGDLLQEIKCFNLSCGRVFSILDNNEFKKENFGESHFKNIEGNLEFRNVHFGYNNNEVLKGLSFKVESNETVAFVGRSGAGKSTIFSLLCKLYDIDSGKILIDGKDISKLDEESIRNNITIISQNPYIFNMSIRDNFKLVKKNVTDEEIDSAVKLACLDEYIESLPDGYDTIVGEGGVVLSGGQRQRLAIARAFVQDTKIILFDEATSALDNETQSSIAKAINNMKDKYTILIIAHRLSTIVNSDRIMLLDEGKITESGTHKELLKKSKTYKKLYESEILKKS